jgi:hypothetical protein
LAGSAARVAFLAVLASAACLANSIIGYDYTWTGPPIGGIWQGVNWNGSAGDTGPVTGYVSYPTASVYIPGGNVVTVGNGPNNTWAGAGSLTVDSGSQVVVPPGYSFQVASTLNNAGDILVGGPGNGSTADLIAGGSVGYGSYVGATFSGGGTVTLSGGALTPGNYGSLGLLLSDQTVQGSGLIDMTALDIESPSKIDANIPGATLLMDSLAGNSVVTNNDIMQASNGGILQLGSSHWNGGPITVTQGSGGVIQALAGSTVMLGWNTSPQPNDYGSSSSITAGTLAGAGSIQARDGFILNGVANSGTIDVLVNSNNGDVSGLVLEGSINNTGTILLDTANLGLGANTTLTGSGTVQLNGMTFNANGYSISSDNTWQGTGTLVLPQNGNTGSISTFTNSGTINANVSGATLLIDGGRGSLANSGTMEATGGAVLQLGSSHWNNGPIYITQTGAGSIVAGVGSTVMLGYNTSDYGAPGSITGGTLTGPGRIEARDGFILDSVANAGDLHAIANTANGSALALTLQNLAGNSGAITVENGATMAINGTTNLTGGGTLFLNGGNVTASGATITSDNLVHGSGSFSLSASTFVNNGTIAAGTGQTLGIGGSDSTVTNNGTVQVASGGTVMLGNLTNYQAATQTLSGGTYDVGGTFVLYTYNGTPSTIVHNAATLILNGPGASVQWGYQTSCCSSLFGDALTAYFADNLANGTFEVINGATYVAAGNFSNEGIIDVGAGSAFGVGGTFTNTGTLNVDGTLTAALMAIAAGQKRSGTGTVESDVAVYGTAQPGDDPGILTVAGDYTQEPGSTLDIELGGTALGQYDQLNIDGNLSLLGGDLDVLLWNGYVPTTSASFDILNWTGSLSGPGFDSIEYPALPAGYYFQPEWSTNSLTPEVLYNGGPAAPDPATFWLVGCGLLAGGYWRGRRHGKRQGKE